MKTLSHNPNSPAINWRNLFIAAGGTIADKSGYRPNGAELHAATLRIGRITAEVEMRKERHPNKYVPLWETMLDSYCYQLLCEHNKLLTDMVARFTVITPNGGYALSPIVGL